MDINSVAGVVFIGCGVKLALMTLANTARQQDNLHERSLFLCTQSSIRS